ncbi:hypothetical protein FRC12_001224 [Ceratobasidium sp. 428]|nr:hypothetical protein FRC12_001224 [Ceratobasidium sp. 428]
MASSSKTPDHHTQDRVATSSTGSKRKAESLAETNPSDPHSRTTPRKPRDGVADTTTPRNLGSAQRTKESSGNAGATSRPSRSTKFRTTDATHSRTSNTVLATPDAPKQFEMDRFLESEMQGTIFCDPKFVENFLSVDSTRLQTVLEDCEDGLDALRFNDRITRERQLYDSIREVLNIIKAAVDGENTDQFLNVSAEPITAHYDDMAGIKPDLVLFEGDTHHWETVRTPIEVKRQATYLKTGMKQLTRYARAVFAHQLHRRHLYGLVVCKWEATFVRFDRSGILHSKPMDIRSQEFREAFAGLMMLDEEAFGYDTAFTTRPRRDGRLEFYVDLPAEAFPPEEGVVTTTNEEPDSATGAPGPSNSPGGIRRLPTRRLKVMERLCHRKSIRGRATIVLRVREVIQAGTSDDLEEAPKSVKTRGQKKNAQASPKLPEKLGTQDYVLKLMWRDPNKRMEGEVLERLVGTYGVAQHMWHSDVFKTCSSPDCGGSLDDSCGGCVDRTPGRARMLITKNLTDLNIAIPEEAQGEEETVYREVETNEYSEVYAKRTSRIYCRLLMSTVGSPLCSAESPRQLLQAVLDAILGYWGLVNKGLLHRDISDGNVLMLQEGRGYNKQEWKNQQEPVGGQDVSQAESEKLLQNVLKTLGRDPSGILNDFDLFTTHNQMGASFFDEPTSEGDESAGRVMKRRKLDSSTSTTIPSTVSGKGKAPETYGSQESSLTQVANADKGASCKDVDFRTGTPTFMSYRVLKIPIGERYQHSFMDDLESFFWVILWCVAEHVDANSNSQKVAEQIQGAAPILNLLDQFKLENIASAKFELLGGCFHEDGAIMKRALASCKNSWAADPMIAKLVLKMGAYFVAVRREKIAKYKPVKVFPVIVKMIVDALEQTEFLSESDSESD